MELAREREVRVLWWARVRPWRRAGVAVDFRAWKIMVKLCEKAKGKERAKAKREGDRKKIFIIKVYHQNQWSITYYSISYPCRK